MVTKSKGAGAKKKGKVKVLNLNKETVKDLTAQERKKIKGGLVFASQVWQERAIHADAYALHA